uniref:Integrase catalytic domain-containing protein n=1 Tax=Panagrolaimus sp. ES5 TaxID=591445 RepID=A0AC34GA76_9BILA
KAELKHLGFLISREGIRPDPTNVEKVKNFERPQTLTQLKSFNGAVSYFRKFIQNFSLIMSPLHDLTTRGEDVKKNWTDEHEKAFKTVIQKLVEAPVLAPPKFGVPFEIHTDASKIAAGSVLYQRDNNNQLHPICYYSRRMNKHERNYSSIELEALSVVAALKTFRPYIEGSGTTIIRTDSSACCSLMKNRNLQGRLAKFQLCIMAFDVKFEHVPGKDNKFADYLSRYPVNIITLRSGKTLASSTPLKTVIEEQRKEYMDIFNAIKLNQYPENAEDRKKLEMKMVNIVMKNSALYYFNEEESEDIRLLIPYSLREKIINEFHADAVQGAHLGQMKTLEKMKRRVFWPFMVTDIKETIRGCSTCQTSKVNPGDRVPEPLAPIPAPEFPFDRIHVDILGPVIKSTDNFKYILVIVDAFSKYLIAVPMLNQTARTVAQVFIDNVLTKHGSVNKVTTDNGKQFICTIFKELSTIYGFQHRSTTPYHQSSNGQVERQNLTIANMLRGTLATGGEEWTELLQMVLFAFNTS